MFFDPASFRIITREEFVHLRAQGRPSIGRNHPRGYDYDAVVPGWEEAVADGRENPVDVEPHDEEDEDWSEDRHYDVRMPEVRNGGDGFAPAGAMPMDVEASEWRDLPQFLRELDVPESQIRRGYVAVREWLRGRMYRE